MKTTSKTNNTTIKKTRRRTAPVTSKVSLTQVPLLRTFRLVEYKHTGKIIHHRHTSHLALIIILFIVGFFLYASSSIVRAEQLARSGQVSIDAVVPGPAPVVGATIVSPANGGNVTEKTTIDVSGTCAPGTFVVIQNNQQLAGSTVCTDAGIFLIQLQLRPGANALSALNYDNLNQTGPVTPTINLSLSVPKFDSNQLQMANASAGVKLPANPSIVAGLSPKTSTPSPSCIIPEANNLPSGSALQVAVVCVPRFTQLHQQSELGVTAWGGTGPYALSVDWGDGSENTLKSLEDPGTNVVKFSYTKPGIHEISVKLTDKVGAVASVQTAVQTPSAVTQTPLAAMTGSIFNTSWFETPVPLYLMAVAITLGFWGGDIFDRNYGASKPRPRARKIA